MSNFECADIINIEKYPFSLVCDMDKMPLFFHVMLDNSLIPTFEVIQHLDLEKCHVTVALVGPGNKFTLPKMMTL